MNKEIIQQYYDLKKEIADIKQRINLLKKQKDPILKDSVKGSIKSFPYIQTNFKLEGVQQNSPRNNKIKRYTKMLEKFRDELLDLEISLEEYIESLPNIRIRNILRYKYIDGMSWIQVANKLGGNATENSVRMEYKRFLKEN